MGKVVVVGAGFAGVFAVKGLLKKLPRSWTVVLISEKEHFLFKPLIHEVASGAFGEEVVCEPISESIKSSRLEFIQGKADKVDFNKQLIFVGGKRVPYDYLVIAVGSKTNFYNIPGAEKNAYKLTTVEDALAIRSRLLSLFADAAPEQVRVLVIGGGPTGCELSAELAQYAGELAKRFGKDYTVTVLELNSLIPQESDSFRKLLLKRFKLGRLNILLNAQVTFVKKGAVEFLLATDGKAEKKKIAADMVVWTAGIKPADLQTVPTIERPKGFFAVDQYLRVKSGNKVFVNVFAVGDCALVTNPDGKVVPQLAQAAAEEGKFAASNVLAAINNKQQQSFIFKRKGFILPLGKGVAIANIKGFVFDGFFAWWLNRTIYLMNMLTLRHKLKVAWIWTVGLFRRRHA